MTRDHNDLVTEARSGVDECEDCALLAKMADAIEAQQVELETERGAMQNLSDECKRLKAKLTETIAAGDSLIERPMGVVSDAWLEATDWPHRG